MDKIKLIEDLKTISEQIVKMTNGVGFVGVDKIRGIDNDINHIISNLEIKGVDIESKQENGIEFCGLCGQKISLKRRRIEKTMIFALIKAIEYCRHNKLKTFHKKDVDLNPVEYTLITFLVKFGLLYKSHEMKAGEFGIPFKICAEFFKGQRNVMEFYEIDPTKKEGEDGYRIHSENRIYFKDLKNHDEILKDYPYTIEFLNNSEFESII